MTVGSSAIAAIADQLRESGKFVGYTSGVFDFLHYGHINYLRECKAHCEVLVVGIDDDFVVRRNKGQDRPYEKVEQRVAKVFETGFVDFVFIKTGSSLSLLPHLKPFRCFFPSNRKLSSSRVDLIHDLSIEIVRVAYTEGVSTSHIAIERK